MISNTLRDLTKIANEVNAMTDSGEIQKRKKYELIIILIGSYLESHKFDGEKGELRLDPAEVCQILNLNPETEEDLISYIPTLKRFYEYQRTLFLSKQ